MTSELVFLLITGLLALFIALVVSLSHGVSRWTKVLFVAICLSLTLWQVNIYIADSVSTHLVLWNNLVFIWPAFSLVSTFFFVLLVRNVSHNLSLAKEIAAHELPSVIVSGSALVQISLAAMQLLFSDVIQKTGEADVFVRGAGYPVYIALLLVQLGTIIVYLVRNFRKSKLYSQERHALKTVLLTIVLVAIYAVLTNVVIPVLTDSQRLISMGILSIDIFALGFAFSIIRYRFLDIRGYAFRAGVYLLVFSIAIACYALFANVVVTNVLNVQLTTPALTLLTVMTLVIAISFQPLKAFFNRITNKLFYRDYYDTQALLDRVSTLLVGTVDIDEIKNDSRTIVESTFRPSNFEYLLDRDDSSHLKDVLALLRHTNAGVVLTEELDPRFATLKKMLRKHDIALAINLQTTHEDLGYMLLGTRRSGAMYTTADRRILRTIADEIALGLQNALRFEEIERFSETLQQKVDDATRKLRNSNEKLRRLDETKDDFISMASHQLRTPLTSVKGYVSMVLEGDAGPLTNSQRKLLTQSFVSAQRMVYLISDLLNVSRLRTGKFVIEPIPCNIAQVTAEEVKQLIETAKGRNLELVYHRPERFSSYMLDEMKLRQVIMNFIDNAIYYTPSGGTITVSTVEKPQSIEFTVVDTGIGVPKSEQHHLFSKFYRADNAKTARPDGTGLGLFMAKKVIVAQGGATIFRSQEGKGSTFGFSFAKSRLTPVEK